MTRVSTGYKHPNFVRNAVLACSLRLFAACAVLALASGGGLAQDARPRLTPELENVRRALEKYRDPYVAVHDGYLSTVGCVEYPDGGMGVHFLNLGLTGPTPDPMRPNLLIYEPDGEKLRLVAAEWFIPLATGIKERPTLFGQPFDGPMEGHHPLQPRELHHYDLHVWLFKANPAGLFQSTNPDVKCVGRSPYAIAAEKPKLVPHQ